MRPAAVLFALLLGCSGGKDTADTSEPPAPGTSGNQDCGDTPPAIEDMVISDYGFFQCEAVEWPSILIQTQVSDSDGDLTYYTKQLWWDTTIDGVVDPSGSPLESQKTLSETPCSTSQADLGLILCITGAPPYSTEVEFGVVVFDADGNPSNNGVPTVATFTTPDENGNY